ncbi:hypothetical protein [Nocardioides sp. WS12]|uniref:hypothetical protein n=1 Tax=Nocardioides sp. WS12 TaxID=2486272 RepID=UPI0015F8C990|nr:hypothetical protein [Nocardioides sp. WS12]
MRKSVPTGLLAVALVALLVIAAVLWNQDRDTWDDGAVAVAKEEATNFFTLDHSTADADVDRVLALATGKLKKDYAGERDTVVASAVEQEVVSSASAPRGGAAVEYAGTDTAKVLVALDVTSSAKGVKTQDKRVRLRVTVDRVDGAWLVSAIEEVR